jgi:hypothetical protein
MFVNFNPEAPYCTVTSRLEKKSTKNFANKFAGGGGAKQPQNIGVGDIYANENVWICFCM